MPKASVSGKPIRKDWRDTDVRSVMDTSCLMETTHFIIQGLFTWYWYIGRRTLVWTVEHSVDNLYANKKYCVSTIIYYCWMSTTMGMYARVRGAMHCCRLYRENLRQCCTSQSQFSFSFFFSFCLCDVSVYS